MGSIFDSLQTDENAKGQEEKLGRSYINKTGKYDMVVKMAYASPSQISDSMGISIVLEDENGAELKETVYISYQDGKTFKVDKKGNSKEHFGFTKIKRLNYLLTGTEGMPKTDKKTIKLWDYDAQKETPQNKDVLVEWIGKPVTVLAIATKEFKRENDGTGKWVDTEEIKKYMDLKLYVDAVTLQTASEKQSSKDAELATKWIQKFDENFVHDKTDGAEDPKDEKEDGSSNAKNDGDSPFGG